MITIISGTNRTGNVSVSVAATALELLTSMGVPAQLLDLQKLPRDFVFRNDVYGTADPGFSAIASQFVADADGFIFIVPEYNGSFPGVCKAFIDAVWPEYFHGKKAALIGLSSGRAGNVRGLDHLTNILNYLQVTIHPMKQAIPHIEAHLNNEGRLNDEKTIKTMERMLKGLVGF